MKTVAATVSITQSAVTVDDITDPTTINAGIELIDQDAVKLQLQPLQARRVIVRLGASMVVFYTSNLRVRTRTKVREDLLAYVTFGPRASGTVNGLPVRPGMMLAAAPQSEAAFVVDAGWEGMTFMVSPQVIGEHLAIRQRDPEFHRPQGVEALQVSEARAQQLFDWGRRLVDTAVHDPSLFNDSEAERGAAQVELIETLLAALDRAKDLEAQPRRSDATGAEPHREDRRGPRHVKGGRQSLRDGPVQGRGRQRTHTGICLQGSDGADASGLSGPASAASGAPGLAGRAFGLHHGLGASAQLGLLALR